MTGRKFLVARRRWFHARAAAGYFLLVQSQGGRKEIFRKIFAPHVHFFAPISIIRNGRHVGALPDSPRGKRNMTVFAMEPGEITALCAGVAAVAGAAGGIIVKFLDAKRENRKDAVAQLEAVANRLQKQLDQEADHSKGQDKKIDALMEENVKCNERAALLQGKVEAVEKSMLTISEVVSLGSKNYDEIKSTRHELRGQLQTMMNLIATAGIAANNIVKDKPVALAKPGNGEDDTPPLGR